MNDQRKTDAAIQPPLRGGIKRCTAASRVVLALALAGLLSGGTALSGEPPPQSSESTRYLEALGQANNTAYNQVSPAVVLVTTIPHWRLSKQLPRFHPPLDEEEWRGIGSGTVVSSDGYILSNYHVIKTADSITVTLSDRRVFDAEVVGFDSLIDIALLKIQTADLPTVRLGDSDKLKIGDLVLAIGYPLGLGTTLTDGIVSALGRQAEVIDAEYRIESFIQTTAAINPGNSGGPLLNLRGEVVGINTAISTRTGYFIGYGLAVPINLAREAMNDILVHGRVVRGYLGVEMLEVTQDLVRERGLDMGRPTGVYIDNTLPGSPAERGGLQAGDILLRVAGRPVDLPNQVQTIIYGLDPGDTLTLGILRAGVQEPLQVMLGEREVDRLLARGRQRLSQLGLTVQVLTEEGAGKVGFTGEIAAELGFAENDQTIVVTGVDPDGVAASKGIKVHDVITEIDQEHINSLEQLAHFVSRLEQGQAALFWFWRQDQGIDVRALRIPE